MMNIRTPVPVRKEKKNVTSAVPLVYNIDEAYLW